MEESAKLHADLEITIPKLRGERSEKRKNRRQTRKITLKALKFDDKGYLNIVLDPEEIPEEIFNANGDSTDTLTTEQKDNIKKSVGKNGRIFVCILGIILTVTAVYTFTKPNESE